MSKVIQDIHTAFERLEHGHDGARRWFWAMRDTRACH